jgi:hypothetical protein
MMKMMKKKEHGDDNAYFFYWMVNDNGEAKQSLSEKKEHIFWDNQEVLTKSTILVDANLYQCS